MRVKVVGNDGEEETVAAVARTLESLGHATGCSEDCDAVFAVGAPKYDAGDLPLCRIAAAAASDAAAVSAAAARVAQSVSRQQQFLRDDAEAAAFLRRSASQPSAFARVRAQGVVYLDYGGAAIHTDRQAEAASALLRTAVLANPHSGALTSSALADRCPAVAAAVAVADARARVAAWLSAPVESHSVAFVSGATAAMRTVGDCFAWSAGGSSRVCFLHDNHNSALGVRELACAAGAEYVPLRDEAQLMELVERTPGPGPHLLVLPGQNNFSGERYDLGIIERLRAADRLAALAEDSAAPEGEKEEPKRRWFVLLDAAALVPHATLDLTQTPADFVALSFYKVFGLPTGLGALVIRNDAAAVLSGKRYFGGGTVSASLQSTRFHVLRESVSARFEDGTVSFLDIAFLKYGFESLAEAGGAEKVGEHASALTRYLARSLLSLCHGNGRRVCTLAGHHERLLQQGASFDEYVRVQGPTIAFNMCRADGAWVGPSTVSTLASLCGIQIRAGCMCNPAACNRFLGLSDEEVMANAAAGRVCWSEDMDVLSGKPTGAVRVSLGRATCFEDVDAFLAFITENFVQPEGAGVWPESPPNLPIELQPLTVGKIYVFPIKSCSPFATDSWEIASSGMLLYDREWAVLGPDGNALSQKQYPRLCQVVPTIDLERGVLHLDAVGFRSLEIPLPRRDSVANPPKPETGQPRVLVCSRRMRVAQERDEDRAAASAWFSELLGVACTWARAAEADKSNKGSFQNSADFLVISQASVEDLHTRLPPEAVSAIDIVNFRPNIEILGARPFQEDQWKAVQIGPHVLTAWKLCSRCPMACVDRRTATIGREPLLTLAKYRNFGRGLMFGHLMNRTASTCPQPWIIARGMRVIVLEKQPQEKYTVPDEVWARLEERQKAAASRQ